MNLKLLTESEKKDYIKAQRREIQRRYYNRNKGKIKGLNKAYYLKAKEYPNAYITIISIKSLIESFNKEEHSNINDFKGVLSNVLDSCDKYIENIPNDVKNSRLM